MRWSPGGLPAALGFHVKTSMAQRDNATVGPMCSKRGEEWLLLSLSMSYLSRTMVGDVWMLGAGRDASYISRIYLGAKRQPCPLSSASYLGWPPLAASGRLRHDNDTNPTTTIVY